MNYQLEKEIITQVEIAYANLYGDTCAEFWGAVEQIALLYTTRFGDPFETAENAADYDYFKKARE